MFIIGLTGGIGSGKSTVSRLFEARGVQVIDADLVARQVVEPGQAALDQIRQRFGPQVISTSGELDRQRLRQIVFADEEKRAELEALLHPIILSEMLRQGRQARSAYVIFAIPLLLETGQQEHVDRILVIDADEQTRRQRVRLRDNLSDAEIDAIMQAQWPRDERLAAADDIITNNGTTDSLNDQVEALHRRYLALARNA